MRLYESNEGAMALPEAAQIPQEISTLRRIGSWARRHKTALLLGAAGASAAVTFGLHPGETVDEIEAKAPWVIPAAIATDAVNVAGIAMMAGSVGHSIEWRKILQLKSQLATIAEKSNGSKVFNAGFWTSTAGGVGFFGVGAAAVLPNFPVESWGMLTPLAAELGQTVMTRVAIRHTITVSAPKNTPHA